MNHRKIGPVIVALVLFAAFPLAASGQTTATKGAKITGILVEKGSAKPVSGMWLHLLKCEGKDKEGKDVISLFILNGRFPRAKSDSSGHFSFADVPAGRYIIKSGTENSFATTDAAATALRDSKGSIIVVKLLASQALDLGKVSVDKQ